MRPGIDRPRTLLSSTSNSCRVFRCGHRRRVPRRRAARAERSRRQDRSGGGPRHGRTRRRVRRHRRRAEALGRKRVLGFRRGRQSVGLAALTIAAETLVSSGRRRERGGMWWRGVRAPLSSREVLNRSWAAIWDLVKGGVQIKQPSPADLSGRYVDLLSENLGQPGFRELVIAAHDLDARRDLIFALVAENRRRTLIRRASTAEADLRRAEVVDLSGTGRLHVADAVAAALAVPVVND